MIVSIESPADWDWNKGLKIEFAIAGGEDGNVLCGIYEAVLTKRPGNIAQIPVRLLNPGGLCKPGEIQVHSLGIAEERIKAELEKKRSAEEAEARRVYLAQFPVLFNRSEEVFVGSDRKCSQQFMEALSMEGLGKAQTHRRPGVIRLWLHRTRRHAR